MRTQWILPVLLSSGLIVGCGDRGAQNTEENQNTLAQPGAPAPAPPASNQADRTAPPPDSGRSPERSLSPNDDNRATRLDSRETRATTGSRPSSPRAARVDDAPATPAAPRAVYREVTVPAGTALPLELTTALSSDTSTVETPVRARLRQGISVDGHTAIPAGTVFMGHVTDVADAGRVQGRAHVTFSFTEAQIDGSREDLRTNPLTFQAEATKGEDATKIGAGAGIGAVIGGIVGGGKGAAKGAAIGGAAGTGAVLATKGKEVSLTEGTDLAATLAQPFSVRVQTR